MKRMAVITLVFFLLSWCSLAMSFADDSEIVLVGHKDVSDVMEKEEIRKIFLGQKTRWDNDGRIVFALLDEHDTYRTFLKEFVGKTHSQYKNYWKKQVFTGKGRMPKTFKTCEELLRFLARTEGAVSFVKLQDVQPETVKVIAVE